MKYYQIFAIENNHAEIIFGDHDKAAVLFEIQAMRDSGIMKKNIKMVTLASSDQKLVDAAFMVFRKQTFTPVDHC